MLGFHMFNELKVRLYRIITFVATEREAFVELNEGINTDHFVRLLSSMHERMRS